MILVGPRAWRDPLQHNPNVMSIERNRRLVRAVKGDPSTALKEALRAALTGRRAGFGDGYEFDGLG
jgi:hypothetical protein